MVNTREYRLSSCHVLFIAIALAAVASRSTSALGVPTHLLANRVAVATSTLLQDCLRDALGLRDGLQTRITGPNGSTFSIQRWIEEGGAREDDLLRPLTHFHDPLRPWASAGKSIGPLRYESSVRWMQEPDQSGEGLGGWSWRDARQLYYRALTESDPVRREALWADLFRALGQIMHLVVDASVPEHARDDAHVLGALGLATSYERWVGEQQGAPNSEAELQFVARYLSAPIGFDSAILRQPVPGGEPIATAPVAHLIDADRYDATNPGVTLEGAIGLAEIANANFYSEDTLDGAYPFPTDTGLVPVNLATATGRVRRYFSRPAGQGLLPANPLRAECAADLYFAPHFLLHRPPYKCVDSLVWAQVATHMLPRAVGYARGVLDYFFRGGLRVAGIAPRADGVVVTIENTTGEPMEGAVEVFGRQRAGTARETRQLVSVLNGGQPVSIAPFDQERLLLPLSAPSGSPYHVLVFRGRLGLEQDAVVGQVFAVPDVQIVQESYDADVAKRCTTTRTEGEPPDGPVTEELMCAWTPINHRVHGRIVTNFAAGSPDAGTALRIERIEASWADGAGSPAALVVGGVTQADGIWIRGQDDQDPAEFDLIDGHARGDAALVVAVFVSGADDDETSMQMATFKSNVSWAVKSAVTDSMGGDWLVNASRNWRIDVNVPFWRLRPTSIGGFPVPTVRERERDFLQVGTFGAEYFVNDFRASYATRSEALDAFEPIVLINAFPVAPDLGWSAVVTTLPVDPMVVQFRQAFGATGAPSPIAIVLRGHEPVSP